MHGQFADMRVLGVPGNPVSAFVCAVLFLVPLIRRLPGAPTSPADRISRARHRPAGNDERSDYLRATLETRDGRPVATPLPVQDSSMMATLAKADCLIIREPFAPAAPAGSPCAIVKLGL